MQSGKLLVKQPSEGKGDVNKTPNHAQLLQKKKKKKGKSRLGTCELEYNR